MKKVLILEDQTETREALGKIVESVDSSVKVFLAESVQQAYLWAMEYTMNIFMIDIILEPGKKGGDTSGIRFAENIRKNEKYIQTPMIFVTSLYDSRNFVYSELYCYKYIEKPFDVNRVRAVVEQALRFRTVEDDTKFWHYSVDGILGAVPLCDVIYVTSRNHILYVVTKRETIRIPNKPCKDFYEEADSDSFLKCRRGTIVNRRYIKSVDPVNRYIYLNGCKDVLEIGPIMKQSFLEHWKTLA